MKKPFLYIIMLITVSLSFAGSVNGAASDLRASARYFPEDTMVYVSMRIDTETVASLDVLLLTIKNHFTEAGLIWGENIPTLEKALDMAAVMTTKKTYSLSIRPWLGDWAAVGLINVDDLLTQDLMSGSSASSPQIPAAVIIHMIDRAQAATFLEDMLNTEQFAQLNYTQQTVGQYTIFQAATADAPLLMLGADVLIITTPAGQPFFETAPERTLYDSAIFTETLTMLPKEQYHILGYFDLVDYFKATFLMLDSFTEELTQGLSESGEASITTIEDTLPDGITMEDLWETVGQQAFGLTLLESHILLVDFVQKTGDMQRLEELGFVTTPNTTPLNPAFLAYIPAGVDILYHGTDARYEYDIMLEQTNKTETWEREFYQKYSGWFNFASIGSFNPLTSREQMDLYISDIDAKLQPLTGLSLEDDIISWLTGDYVFFADYAVPEPGTASFLTSLLYPGVPVDANVEFGLITQATDPLKAQQVADTVAFAITSVTELGNLTIEPITIGDAKGTLVIIPPQDWLAAPLEIVIVANQDIFMLATRATATAILTGPTPIQTDPHFSGAQSYLLPDATRMGYINEDGFNLAIDSYLGIYLPQLRLAFTTLAASFGDTPPTENPQENVLAGMAEDIAPQQTNARIISALVSSGSFSETALPNNDKITRFALIFNE